MEEVQSQSLRRILGAKAHSSTAAVETEELVMSNVYHRRKIESNWEKYKEAAVTGRDIPVHAADYEELLKATSNVKTQYQFRSFESDVQSSSDSELLSVDCQRLAQSVRCLPLHQRLDVDHSLLDPADIDAFRDAVLDELSRREQTKASVTCAHGSPVHSADTSVDRQLKSPTAADCCQVTSASCAVSAARCDAPVIADHSQSVAAETLTHLEDELDLLL